MTAIRHPRVGVLGAGRWGANLIRTCAELALLESVCEPESEARARLRAQYPRLPILSELDAFLARDIDAVIVATPPATHVELALEAIAAGKHVFVEKPLALSEADALTVRRAARAGRRIVFVGHVVLYHPAIRRAIELVRSGAIGELRHIRARRCAFGRLRARENVWWSLSPHDVAIVLALFESDPIAVSGSLHAFVRPDVADFAYADISFDGGRSAHIESCWLDPEKNAQLDIFGSTGVLRFIDDAEGGTLALTPCGSAPNAHGDPELWREERHAIACDRIEPLRAELCAFANALATGEPALTDADEGTRVVAVLDALERAAHARHILPAEALV